MSNKTKRGHGFLGEGSLETWNEVGGGDNVQGVSWRRRKAEMKTQQEQVQSLTPRVYSRTGVGTGAKGHQYERGPS